MLNVYMLSVVMLSVIMLNVLMLNVIILNAIMLNVVAQCVWHSHLPLSTYICSGFDTVSNFYHSLIFAMGTYFILKHLSMSMEQHLFSMSFIIEGATEKVPQFIIPVKSIELYHPLDSITNLK